MKLIVGLGNPGRLYIDSRHNIGFLLIRALAKSWNVNLKKDRQLPSLIGKARFKGRYVLLAMPLTFMNLSGVAVAELVNKYDIDIEDLLVVCDDLDLELGRIRLKPRGSSGGHRGLRSIIDTLETDGFCRLRIGIGRAPLKSQTSDYVLSSFNKQEKAKIKDIIENAASCCQAWLTEGLDKCMNAFNVKDKNSKS